MLAFSAMRMCWNWQTGMTKDHVLVGRAGSSPAIRRMYKAKVLAKGFSLFYFFTLPL